MKILRQQFLQHIGQTSPSPLMIEVEKANGVFFHTPQGRKVMDLVSGVSVSNVGHGNPYVIEAVQKQAQEYMHTMVYGETIQRVQVQYARELAMEIGGDGESVYFVNSGAEAIEVAMKLIKRATGRSEIISMLNAYHGSTHGALSIQGGEEFKNSFRPLLPECRQIRFNNMEDLQLITNRTAGVVTEVVQGESGVNPANGEWLAALRKRCDEVGALLVFDEIQTGFGRSGSMFAFQNYGVRADLVCLAKALGGGMPLGAVVANKNLLDCFTENPVLGHINTFGGNPVCCAAGLAAFRYIKENELCENASARGLQFEEKLKIHPKVKAIRRAGLLLAVELGDSGRMFEMVGQMLNRGYMTDWFLFCDTAFRISPPLTISEAEVAQACEDIIELLDEL